MGRTPARAYLYLIGTALCWSGVFVAVKVAASSMPVPALIAARYAAATAVFAVLSTVRPGLRPSKDDLPLLVLLGLIGVTVYNLFFFYGVSLSTAVNASLIVPTSVPVVSSLLAAMVLGEKISAGRLVGLLMAGTGVATISIGGHGGPGPANLLGDLLLVGAVLSWALYTVLGRVALRKYPPLTVTTFAHYAGTPPLVVAALLDPATPAFFRAPPVAWAMLGYLVVFATVVAFVWYYAGIRLVGAGRAAVFLYLVPVGSVILAVMTLGEPLYPTHLLGALFVVGGLILAQR